MFMRKLILISICLVPTLSFAKFINPLEFDGSDAQKQEVIQYIKDRVKAVYCDGQLNMCQETTLRMMEQENLKAFKEASQAKDKKIMESVINTYCNGSLNMCDYTTINMMYNQNHKASKEELQW